MKMGFFHRITRKALWGPVWEDEVLVRFGGVEKMPPGSQCLIQARWLSSVLLQKNSSLVFPKPGRRARVRKFCAIVLTPVRCSVVQFTPKLSPAQSLSFSGQRGLCSWLCSAALRCLPHPGLCGPASGASLGPACC